MSTVDTNIGFAKPIKLRIIFILNALKIFLTLGFFLAFKYGDFVVQGLEGDSAASLMLYTMFGYMAAFAVMVFSILRRNILGLRIAIAVDFLISIPAKAFIGFAVALIAMALTFTKPVTDYFGYKSG